MPLTILGLGPGAPELLTLEAQHALGEAREIYLRTARHPTAAALPAHLDVHSFDELYEREPTFDAVYAAIVERVWQLAQRPGGVLYAVPGHPLVAEATVVQLLQRARRAGMPVRVIAGLSFVEPALQALEVDPFAVVTPDGDGALPRDFPGLAVQRSGLQLVDALLPELDPSRPALVGQLFSREIAAQLKLELLELYPPQHEVALVAAAGLPEQRVLRFPLFELDRGQPVDHLTCLYLPPLPLSQNVATFDGFAAIVARLRAPGGCPWDREQDHGTLKPYLIEEAYEALDALERGDPDALRQELGDLLLNLLLHCQIAAEHGEFDARDMVRGISEKILRRHPHVFGDLHVSSSQQVLENWEALKAKERPEEVSMLQGMPRSLPGLAFTRSLQERIAPLHLEGAGTGSGTAEQGNSGGAAAPEKLDDLGERLFALAWAAAAQGLDPEEALRAANRRFVARVERLEQAARTRGVGLRALGPEERAALWRSLADSG